MPALKYHLVTKILRLRKTWVWKINSYFAKYPSSCLHFISLFFFNLLSIYIFSSAIPRIAMGMSWVSDIMRYTADNGKESPGTDKPVTPLIVPAPASAVTILTHWSLDTPTIRSWQFHRVLSLQLTWGPGQGNIATQKELMQNIFQVFKIPDREDFLKLQTYSFRWKIVKFSHFLILWVWLSQHYSSLP